MAIEGTMSIEYLSNFSSMKGICGVYILFNNASGKIYVGATKDIGKRIREHLSALRGGRHFNNHLQYAWDFYGEMSFSAAVLEVVNCDDWEIIGVAEDRWIEKLNACDQNFGYNLLRYSSVKPGCFSEETLNRIGSAWRGKKKPRESVEKQASKLRGRIRPKHLVERAAAVSKETNSMNYRILSPDGVEYQIKGLKRFCKENDLYYHGMSRVSAGKLRDYKGWRCERV